MQKRKNIMSWEQTVGLTMLIASAIYILLAIILISKSQAEGAKFIAEGTLWPKDALVEIQKAANTLANVRKAIDKAEAKLVKARKNFSPLRKKVEELEARLSDAEKFKAHKLDVQSIYDDLNSFRNDLYALRSMGLLRFKNLADIALAQQKQLNSQDTRISKLEGMNFGVSLYVSSSLSYGPMLDKIELGGTASGGAGIYLTKGLWTFRPNLGAGVNLASQHFSWIFSASAEANLGKGFHLGPYASLENDMGKFTRGADSMYGSLGALLRYNMSEKTSIFLTVGAGVYAQKGDKPSVKKVDENTINTVIEGSDPSFSPSFNSSLGFTYDVL